MVVEPEPDASPFLPGTAIFALRFPPLLLPLLLPVLFAIASE